MGALFVSVLKVLKQLYVILYLLLQYCNLYISPILFFICMTNIKL